ncbi:MAG: sugar phosphate nucleotidyltransferase [Burkholderiales bacterium]
MKVLALVLAGGNGTRLYPLTARHAKPALPLANGYRIIDFVLSNLVNSGIGSIYVLAQYQPHSLVEHLAAAWAPHFNARDRFLKVILPKAHEGAGSFRGTADAVYKNRHLIERHRPELVGVFAADHVYRMDVRQMAAFHEERGAEVSVAAIPVPLEKASSFGVMVTAADGRIEEFQEKPQQPTPIATAPHLAYASMGNYLFGPDILGRLLEEAAANGWTDFGQHILPSLPGRCRIFAYDFSENRIPGVAPYEERAYWRDVGTLEALAAARQDVAGLRPRFNLYNRHWPILGGGYRKRPAVGEDDGLRGETGSGGAVPFPPLAEAAVEARSERVAEG